MALNLGLSLFAAQYVFLMTQGEPDHVALKTPHMAPSDLTYTGNSA